MPQWQISPKDPYLCPPLGEDRHKLRTLLESTNRNEEEALWEFLTRSSEYLVIPPGLEPRIFPLKRPSFPLTPIEVFQKVSPIQRRKLFFKSLNRGDILFLKVIEEKSDCFKLLALDKYKGCMKIDDLNILMDLPKLPQELKHLFPHPFSVIKAALSSCNIKERSLCVTLDKSVLKPEYQDVSLGPLYESYNLQYHGNPFLGISFTDNLFMMGTIRLRNRLSEFSILGIKEKTEYSHFKKSNKRVFSPSLSRSALRERLLQATSVSYYKLAKDAFDAGRIKRALSHLKQALLIRNDYPDALLLAGKCFNTVGGPRNVQMFNKEQLDLFSSTAIARKYMSRMLFESTQNLMNTKGKSYARESLEMARILDPDNENTKHYLYTLKDSKLQNIISTINPDKKYVIPCPIKEEVNVSGPEIKPNRRHHKRKSSKKSSRHQKHKSKSSKVPLPPKTSDANSKSKHKSRMQPPAPPAKLTHKQTEELIRRVIQSYEAECRARHSTSESLPPKKSNAYQYESNLMSTVSKFTPEQLNELTRLVIDNFDAEERARLIPGLGLRPSGASNAPYTPYTAHITQPSISLSQPIQTIAPTHIPQEYLNLIDQHEKAEYDGGKIQNQIEASKLVQTYPNMKACEDTSLLSTIISTTSKLLSITQDFVKNSPPSVLSDYLPLLQSHLLSNQLVNQYPLNQLPQINQILTGCVPPQTFLSNSMYLNPGNSQSLQFEEAPKFPLPASENANLPKNDSLMPSNSEGKMPIDPNSQPNNIPFMEYPTTVSASGYLNPSIPGWPLLPNNVLETSAMKVPNPLSQSVNQNTTLSLNKDDVPLSKLKTKYFKPLSPGSKSGQKAELVHKKETSTPVTQKAEHVHKKETSTSLAQKPERDKSPKRSRRRTPQRYRLTPPPRKPERSSSKKRCSHPLGKERRESGHSHRRRDRSPRRRRSRSPRRHRSRSRSPRRHRSRSLDRLSRSHSRGRSRSHSRGRSRSNSLKRFKSNFKGSRTMSLKKVRFGSSSPLPLPSYYNSHRKGSRSSIPFDPSRENLCDVVVSSPSFSDSSPVSYFETQSSSPSAELKKEILNSQSSPEDLDQEISVIGLHESHPSTWQRHVSITPKQKADSPSALYPSSSSYSKATSKDSLEDLPLSSPKRSIPVICSRNVAYK